MQVKFNADRGTGIGYANLLRQVIIETGMNVKPVAYKMSEGETLYKPSEDMIDSVDFGHKLQSLTYIMSEGVQFPFQVDYNFQGALRSKDLCSEDVYVEEDIILCEFMDPNKIVNISLIFDINSGFKSSDANKNILDRINVSTRDYQVIASKHSDFVVAFDIKTELSKEVVTLDITSSTKSETEKIDKVLTQIISKFSEIKENL